MLIYVLWQDKRCNEQRLLERVGVSLERVFEPILGKGRTVHSRSADAAKLVCLTKKPVGKPDAVVPHVRFDERGEKTQPR